MTAPCQSPAYSPPRGNRPGLAAIQTRIGTHGTFLAAMLDRIASGRAAALTGLHTHALDNPAVALCDAWALIGDVLTFYQERIANEAYLRTAVERRSIAEIARLVGYRLRPGVAASVHLAFTLDADAIAALPVGTQVQTVPAGDEPSRRFELVEPLEGRAAWNQLQVNTTQPPAADTALASFHAAGATSPVRPGDTILLAAGDRTALRQVADVASDFTTNRTAIGLVPAIAPAPRHERADAHRDALPLIAELADGIRTELAARAVSVPPARMAARLLDNLSDLLAPDTDLAMRLRGLSMRDCDSGNLYAALDALPAAGAPMQAQAMRLRTAPFGAAVPPPLAEGHHSAKDSGAKDWDLAEETTVLFVEGIATDILPGSWVAFEAPPGQAVQPPRRVLAASTVARVAYGIAARCTRLLLDGPWIAPNATFTDLRALTVHAASTPIPLASDDIATPITGGEIELDRVVGELPPGRWLIVEGELADRPGARMSEAVMLASSRHIAPAEGGTEHARTILRLVTPLAYTYRRSTVFIWGNVARATEGETVNEVLGAGNGAIAGQAFTLSRAPLTYVSQPTLTGVASTLRVVVNGLEWTESDNLSQAGPTDRVFVIEPAGVTPLRIRFGNGVNGARLPTGVDNVVAQYRTGMGAGGNCDAGQVSQLLSHPAGVRAVVNPRPASGGADAESSDDARRNAAEGVTALGRLVGVSDYTDFARAFAGVGKADAVLVHPHDGPTVLVTITGQDETQIGPDADLLHSLADALERFGDPSQAIVVLPARNLRVTLAARVRPAPGYVWAPLSAHLRAALLQRFGFTRRAVGQALRQSEVLAAMHDVAGVADVDLATLAALPDPVTTEVLRFVTATHATGDVLARSGRLARTQAGWLPRAAEIVFFSQDMPELIALSEITG